MSPARRLDASVRHLRKFPSSDAGKTSPPWYYSAGEEPILYLPAPGALHGRLQRNPGCGVAAARGRGDVAEAHEGELLLAPRRAALDQFLTFSCRGVPARKVLRKRVQRHRGCGRAPRLPRPLPGAEGRGRQSFETDFVILVLAESALACSAG